MTKSKHADEGDLQAILDYIQAVMPGVGAIGLKTPSILRNSALNT